MPLAPPETLNFARHLLELNAARSEHPAFIDDVGQLSYGALAEKVRRFASGLSNLGLKQGERILIVLPDRVEWPIAFLGAMYAGLVPIPVNTLLTVKDYAHLMRHSGSVGLIVAIDLLSQVLDANYLTHSPSLRTTIVVGAPDGSPLPQSTFHHFSEVLAGGSVNFSGATTRCDQVAFWLYSSGSTGPPKGVVHTHANLYWTAELYAKPVMGLLPSDRVFSAAKLFFAYGLGNALTFPLSVGACAILMSGRPTPQSVMDRVRRHEATIFCGAPTLYASLLAQDQPPLPTKLRLCTSAGEALPSEVGKRFSSRYGVHILDGLGSTELLHIFLTNRADDLCYGTTGKPVDGYEVQLRDVDGQPIEARDVIGDLWVKGPSAALEYWKEEEKSKNTFENGWVRTGDKYVRRVDGCFVYAGRNDDMLKISGQYVSPFEVESTLMEHPSVQECAVIAAPDEVGIAKSRAYVVLKAGSVPGVDMAEELKAFVKTKLAPFKRPHFVEFVPDLPKTTTGKIQRFRLRESVASQPPSPMF